MGELFFSRGCKSLTGKLVKPVSKSQARCRRRQEWRKRYCKDLYRRTGSTYEADIRG